MGTQKRTGGGGTHRGTDVGIGEGLRNASGATKGGGIKIIDEGVSDKKNDDMKLRVQILIEAEEDPERKALFREYLAKAKKHDAFSFEKNLDDLIHNKFSFM